MARRAAGRAAGGRQPRRDRVLARRSAAAGPGGRGAEGSHGPASARWPHAGDDGADLPGAGRDAAGDRTGRGHVAHHVRRSARPPARRPVPPADRGQPDRAAAAPDAARGGRLELGSAQRRRTDGPAQALGVLGRGEPGSGRAGLRRQHSRTPRRRAGAGARAADRAGREIAAAHGRRWRTALPDARHDQGVRRAPARGGGGIGPGAPGASRLLHRTHRDRGSASSPRRAAGVARRARGRARQHRLGDARRARGGRGAGGDAARGGRGLVLVARRPQDRGLRADHRGHQDARRGDRRGPGHGVRACRPVRELRAERRAPGGGVDPQGP